MFELKIAIIFLIVLMCFAWGLYLHRLDRASRTVKILTWIIIIGSVSFIILAGPVFPGNRITHYDDSGNRIGYSQREGDRESHFSISGERKGYSIHRENKTDHFDNNWNRQGRDEETEADEDRYIWPSQKGEN